MIQPKIFNQLFDEIRMSVVQLSKKERTVIVKVSIKEYLVKEIKELK